MTKYPHTLPAFKLEQLVTTLLVNRIYFEDSFPRILALSGHQSCGILSLNCSN